jgi:hypothetical protein
MPEVDKTAVELKEYLWNSFVSLKDNILANRVRAWSFAFDFSRTGILKLGGSQNRLIPGTRVVAFPVRFRRLRRGREKGFAENIVFILKRLST